ncbi:hypothetical protein EUZ85_25650 [Hahella sp. KA22]|uniref:hypothetical protein n=1 Tax=Hahella sp. KA22 TaxID=1628392 RepID=UPI000FDD4BF1|nr:hypothetical protein [Hahella sp. KA22]AZZ93921.1 hypothetical protein ENC22_23065 [Hahella sp. KA22]QAY57295.1 hypothetical protein EUZ85_25650 [Hahella sp. KA22]
MDIDNNAKEEQALNAIEEKARELFGEANFDLLFKNSSTLNERIDCDKCCVCGIWVYDKNAQWSAGDLYDLSPGIKIHSDMFCSFCEPPRPPMISDEGANEWTSEPINIEWENSWGRPVRNSHSRSSGADDWGGGSW